MHDEIGPGFSEEFIREVVTALATIGAKNGLVTKALQPEISLQPSASIPVDLQGVPSAETFGSLEIFSDPAECKKFWESDIDGPSFGISTLFCWLLDIFMKNTRQAQGIKRFRSLLDYLQNNIKNFGSMR